MANLPPEMLIHHLREWAGGNEEAPDAELVRRFAVCRDEGAFAALLRRHGPMVLGVCRRVLGDWHASEDAFQATFLVLARKASSIRRRASVGCWLYGVARQMAVRARAAAASRRKREQRAAVPPVSGPEADVSWREVSTMLREELDHLPERYQAPLVLCYLGGLTRDEAAARLGWSLRTLHRRLERGRELLHVRLTRRGLSLAVVLGAAALSQHLVASTVSAALAATTIREALGGVPADSGVAALADGFLRASFASKVKVAAALVLACLVVTGCGLAAHRAFSTNATPAPGNSTVTANTTGQRVRGGRENEARRGAAAAQQPNDVRPSGAVNCVAFAPVGDLMAAGCEGGESSVRVWEANGGKERYRLDVKGGVSALAFAHDGKTLAVGGGGDTVWLVDASTGDALGRLGPYREAVSALVFTPDGRTLISGGPDGTVRLWDVNSAEELCRFEAPPGHAIHSLALSANGRTLAAACEEVGGLRHHPILLWDVAARKSITPPVRGHTGMCHNGPVRALSFAPDGKTLASGGMDGAVLLWNAETGQAIRDYESYVWYAAPVQALAFSPDGETLAVGSFGGIFLWEARTGKPLRHYMERDARGQAAVNPAVRSLAFARDGTFLASAGSDDRVRLWRVGPQADRSAADRPASIR
jgi:RNA polymerase sigma factor (sigma-70 family)